MYRPERPKPEDHTDPAAGLLQSYVRDSQVYMDALEAEVMRLRETLEDIGNFSTSDDNVFRAWVYEEACAALEVYHDKHT